MKTMMITPKLSNKSSASRGPHLPLVMQVWYLKGNSKHVLFCGEVQIISLIQPQCFTLCKSFSVYEWGFILWLYEAEEK